MARKATGIPDSGERKLAASVEMVFSIVQEGRERKLRPTKLMMTGRKMEKLLEMIERPKGRRRRSGRKGRACKERRRESRRLERLGKGDSNLEGEGVSSSGRGKSRITGGLSKKAKVFSPAYTRSGRMFRTGMEGPPLPLAPEPGSKMFQAVAEGILRDVKVAGSDGDGGGVAAAFAAAAAAAIAAGDGVEECTGAGAAAAGAGAGADGSGGVTTTFARPQKRKSKISTPAVRYPRHRKKTHGH